MGAGRCERRRRAADVLLPAMVERDAFNSVVPGGWSIAVEMQFYLLFPLLIWLFRRRSGANLCYALIALVSARTICGSTIPCSALAASCRPAGPISATVYFNWWLPHQLVCFGFGILLFDWIERKSSRHSARCSWSALASPGHGDSASSFAPGSHWYVAAERHESAISLLGRHSYAIYLVPFRRGVDDSCAVSGGPDPGVRPGRRPLAGVQLLCDRALIERRFNRLGHVLAAKATGRKPSDGRLGSRKGCGGELACAAGF